MGTLGDHLGPHDHATAISLPVPAAASHDALTWVRAVFVGAPASMRPALVAGWRVGLRLRLGPIRSAEHVPGWSITENAPARAVLTASSPLMDAGNIAVVDQTGRGNGPSGPFRPLRRTGGEAVTVAEFPRISP
ncbi:hypothetical protein [Frankia sp. AgB32]|uniref:hypothetical protein n=1 Tax=Frankia sp. AgB32 TaxID=631119 RepID=UPI00200E58E0|nr:hypothetical protein [Frankia sp. AgB32]MCK9893543.1 hypothetical protein [Frankia sp. AgB32]